MHTYIYIYVCVCVLLKLGIMAEALLQHIGIGHAQNLRQIEDTNKQASTLSSKALLPPHCT